MHGTRAANYAMDEADLIVRDRRALRRPHHRQALRVRAAGEVHPHRRRPGRDLQERAGAHPDRRRREEHPATADRRVPRAGADRRAPGRLVGAHPRLAGAPPAALRGLATARSSRSTWSRRCYEATGGDCILTSDVGQHQMWAAQYFHFTAPAPLDQLRRPRHDGLRPAGRDGREGGLPDQLVACIAGDGSVQMNIQELATCAEDGDPGQGVHHEQRLPGHGPPVAGAVLGPPLLAGRHGDAGRTSSSSPRPTGCTGMRCTDKTTLVDEMREAIETPGPVVVDVRVTGRRTRTR